VVACTGPRKAPRARPRKAGLSTFRGDPAEEFLSWTEVHTRFAERPFIVPADHGYGPPAVSTRLPKIRIPAESTAIPISMDSHQGNPYPVGRVPIRSATAPTNIA
jgi:hypothetical protein